MSEQTNEEGHTHRCDCAKCHDNALDRIKSLEEECAKFREALEFYADPKNWTDRVQVYQEVHDGGPERGPIVEDIIMEPAIWDCGEVATKALAHTERKG